MILDSHVALLILCDVADADEITARLGVDPSEVRQSQSWGQQPDGTMAEATQYRWTLHSPMASDAGDASARLWALVEVIRPFRDRLIALDAKWHPWIDVAYHLAAPQRPSGIAGKFIWFQMPASIMKSLGEWNLDISYEIFWHDHPDRQMPAT